MKTLIITVDYPLPEDKGSRMRTMHFARYFNLQGDVDLMCYKSHVPKDPVTTFFRKEHHVELGKDKSSENDNVIARIYKKYIDCKPWIVDMYTPSVIDYIHKVIINEDYNVILCRYSVNAFPLLSLLEKYRRRVVLDVDDLMCPDLYDAINGSQNGFARLKVCFDKIVFERFQRKCLELGKVIFCSETDMRKMGRYAIARNLYVVPNIIPRHSIAVDYNCVGYGNGDLLFVGSLAYKPNEMGIIWFIQEIFEKLPTELQNINLMVVGKNPQDELKALCSRNEKIVLVENPPDVMPYYEKCMAVIVPVLVGGGTRIKILEAGNYHRPVISTRLGAYGLDLQEYQNILYFGCNKSFVEQLCWLKEKKNYLDLVENMKSVVNLKYTEQAFNQQVNKLLQE